MRKNIGQTSDCTRASTIGKMSAQPQLRRSPQTAETARPPGFRTRCISATARSGSGAYIRPSAHSATSKVPPSRASSSASMRCEAHVGDALRARQLAAPSRSSPRRCRCRAPLPPGATAVAARNVTRPVPQATSSTRSPGARRAIVQQRRSAPAPAAPATSARSARAALSQP